MGEECVVCMGDLVVDHPHEGVDDYPCEGCIREVREEHHDEIDFLNEDGDAMRRLLIRVSETPNSDVWNLRLHADVQEFLARRAVVKVD